MLPYPFCKAHRLMGNLLWRCVDPETSSLQCLARKAKPDRAWLRKTILHSLALSHAGLAAEKNIVFPQEYLQHSHFYLFSNSHTLPILLTKMILLKQC
jgi:hypothetical protein